MAKTYKQLSLEERSLLQTQLAMGWRPAAIAAGLQRARSTITREMLRNGWRPSAKVSWQSRRWRTKLKSYPEVRKQNRIQSKTRSRVEHVFALVKLKFGFVKVRYRGLAKNLNRLMTTCALVNLCTARNYLLKVPAQSRA